MVLSYPYAYTIQPRFMRTNNLKALLPVLLLFIFTACEKGTDEVPAFDLHEEPSCLLTKELVESTTSHTFKYELDYVGPNNQLVYLWSYVLDPATNGFTPIRDESYTMPTYDTRGNIIKAEAFGDYQGDIRATHVWEYNDLNQLTKWTHFRQIDGKLEEVLSYIYEYASPAQLKKLTLASPYLGDNATSYILYEYKNGLMHKMSHYETNQVTLKTFLSNTTQFEYDNMKHPKRKGYAFHIISNPNLYGFPFQHNITKAITTYPGDPNAYVDYTSTFTYNSEGFPLTQRKADYGGNITTHTYTYECRAGN